MPIIGFVIAARLALAVLRMLFAVLVMAYITTLLLGLLLRPRETLAYLFVAAGISLLKTFPLPTLCIVCAMAYFHLKARCGRQPRSPSDIQRLASRTAP